MRLAAPLIAVSLFAALPARAGDAATLDIIGFSADGGVFAFEEYGIQDGSGFPYANRFYIDTASDDFLPGAPIRIRLEDENATVEAARSQARTQGEAILADAVLGANRGFTAGANPVTEFSADPHRIAVNPRPVFAPVDAPLEFRIEELALAQPPDCEPLGPTFGFRLTRIDASPGGITEIVHEDETIPASRGCPLGYSIAAVQTFHPQSGDPVVAVLLAIRKFGFEGPDFRFIAVTGRL